MFAPVDLLDTIDSTNAEAMRRISQGERGPRWIVARAQTGGRGRSGRTWVSPPGNVYASLIVPLDAPLPVLSQVALVAGIAVYDAVRAAAGARPLPSLALKWPNDVLVGGGKLAGILAESTSDPLSRASGAIAVIGIGLNLVPTPLHLAREVATLQDLGIDIPAQTIVRLLDQALGAWLGIWDCGRGFEAIRAGWLARGLPVGTPIKVNAGEEIVTGTFGGLDTGGALLLDDPSGSRRRFDFGDVTLP